MGRPKKIKEDVSEVEAKAREEGKTYGQYMADKQAKEVKVEKTDGIEWHKTPLKTVKIPDRAKKACMLAIAEINEDIKNHKGCIDMEQETINMHIGCIRTHEQAIKELEAELEEQKDFLAQFGG